MCVGFQDEDPAFRGRSLEVKWAAPIVDEDYGDFFANGGSTIPVSLMIDCLKYVHIVLKEPAGIWVTPSGLRQIYFSEAF